MWVVGFELTFGRSPVSSYKLRSCDTHQQFGKTLFASKGPLSNEERKKNAFAEPLATRAPVSTSAGTTHKPPPMRGAQVKAQEGLGSATALYDYEGTDPSDLPCLEGEALTVTEHGGSSLSLDAAPADVLLAQCRRIGGSAEMSPAPRGSFRPRICKLVDTRAIQSLLKVFQIHSESHLQIICIPYFGSSRERRL